MCEVELGKNNASRSQVKKKNASGYEEQITIHEVSRLILL